MPETGDEKKLEPYDCLTKRKLKYAKECTEVYLSNQAGTCLSESFSHFENLESLFLNGNRLVHLRHLDDNFRIRQLYVQDNKLVSLNGIKGLKFLQVLIANNNQIQNLDKQLKFLSRFAFLKKLDLSDNAIADEPDYRLRMIYHVPQVEILDRLTVKDHERTRASEVVPNMDVVAPPKGTEKPLGPRLGTQLSPMEVDCFDAARRIAHRRQIDEAIKFKNTLGNTKFMDRTQLPWPKRTDSKQYIDFWRNPWDPPSPTPFEKEEMLPVILELAGQEELNQGDVSALVSKLVDAGIEKVGRLLKNPRVFEGKVAVGEHSKSHPLQKIMHDPEATMPASAVAEWLLTLEWPRLDSHKLDTRLKQLYKDARRDWEADRTEGLLRRSTLSACTLEGTKTRNVDLSLGPKGPGERKRRVRAESFPQLFLSASREVDEKTGRLRVMVKRETRTTSIGEY